MKKSKPENNPNKQRRQEYDEFDKERAKIIANNVCWVKPTIEEFEKKKSLKK